MGSSAAFSHQRVLFQCESGGGGVVLDVGHWSVLIGFRTGPW